MNANMECIFYGEPLEFLDEESILSRKAPRLEDQVVKDKEGRRRFHGAFTGGFSAGYFNTVGTKEGWAPSNFVSSRSQRADVSARKPTDFMDEEDFEEYGIAPQRIKATASFDTKERKRKRPILESGPIPGLPVLEEILKPSCETVGMQILQKFGWRIGQGIGPRLTHKEKNIARNDKKKLYSSHRHMTRDSEENIGDDENEEHVDILFAPEDYSMKLLAKPKADQFGLGYKPLSQTSVLSSHINLFPEPLKMIDKKKKVQIHGQAFGVGAFEDYDEDIYAREDMGNYDFALTTQEEIDNEEVAVSKHKKAVFTLSQKLEGFSLSSEPYPTLKMYFPPDLPKEFNPLYKSTNTRKSRFERKEFEAKGLGRHTLSANARAHLLGEKETAFVEVRCGVKKPTKLNPSPEFLEAVKEFMNVPEKFSSDFKPFQKDENKQKRYDLFLKMKSVGQKDRYKLVMPKAFTEWEKEREILEFERAAELFLPLKSSMASRFVTSEVVPSDSSLKDGLNTNVIERLSEGAKVADAYPVTVQDSFMIAAKAENYGPLTQNTVQWYPAKLLCKRFNVPNPFPDSTIVGVPQTKREKFSIFNFLSVPEERTITVSKAPKMEIDSLQDCQGEFSPDSTGKAKELSSSIEEMEPLTVNGVKVPPVGEKPTRDLFNAIFQDTDSDDDTEADNRKTDSNDNRAASSKEIIINNKGKVSFNDAIPSKELNSVSVQGKQSFSSGKGIFSCIDFSSLETFWKNKDVDIPEKKSIQETSVTDKMESDSFDMEGQYGPSLPPQLSNRGSLKLFGPLEPKAIKKNIESEELIWVEKPAHNKKHKKKKKKKKSRKRS